MGATVGEGTSALPKVCVIGAGPTGFSTIKRLKDHGIPYDCFEMSDNVGGVWYYKNPNGVSAAYQSLHIDTSKWKLAFEDFPVPEAWPDFPHHAQLFEYFNAYVDHFGLRPTITFRTKVEHARRDGRAWEVRLSTGQTRRYDALAVCNGHHWDWRIPEYPGTFAGVQLHSNQYFDPFDPIDMRGKNVLVVGLGNSAVDIASELSLRPLAKRLFVSTRRGVWIFPKVMRGKPIDKAAVPAWIPRWAWMPVARHILVRLVGRMEDYGLPAPTYRPLDAHPTVSGEFLSRVKSGDVHVKPGVASLDGDGVRFVDGSREPIDVIIWATGYRISFPFFDDPALLPDADNRFPLFKRMMIPGIDNLFFMGLAQPLPTLINLAEQQSKLVAGLLTGRYALPDPATMRRVIAADEAYYLGDFYASARHTMQLDFNHYVRDLRRELARGARRARSGAARLAA